MLLLLLLLLLAPCGRHWLQSQLRPRLPWQLPCCQGLTAPTVMLQLQLL
jgi:hypothetical protein